MKSKRGAGLGSQLLVQHGPSGPWGLQCSPEAATGLWFTESQGSATWGSTCKAPMRLLGSQLSTQEIGSRFCHLFTNNGKGKSAAIMQSIQFINILPWITGQPFTGSLMSSPEIRHVPVERILNEAVYAPIKNK